MFGPNDTVRQLAARGREIRAKLIAISESRKNSNSNVSIGVDVIDAFFDLSGHKRIAAGLGKRILTNSIKTREAKLTQEYHEWKLTVDKTLQNYSTSQLNGKSSNKRLTLKEQFDCTQRNARLETNLRKGIMFLESSAERGLTSLDAVSVKREPGIRIPKNLDSSIGTNARSVLSKLKGHPEVQKSIEGALSVITSQSPDYVRQALGSCRTAIENLVRGLSGEGDWSLGLTKIVKHATERKTIKAAYSYLSAFGTHSINGPSRDNALIGINLALVAIDIILVASGIA
jgi:hypothetical protein